MFRRSILVIVTALLTVFGAVSIQAAPIRLSDFSNGLNGWTYQDVAVKNGAAELNDSNAYSLLYTGVNVTPGNSYTLSFDFATGVAGVTGRSFSGLFATTIFFGASNDFNNSVPDIWLFDNNAGTSNIYNGAVTQIPGQAEWFHFAHTFTASDVWLFPAFELIDENQLYSDVALVNNVSLDHDQPTPVPEPSAVLLLAGGLVGIAAYRRSLKFRNC